MVEPFSIVVRAAANHVYVQDLLLTSRASTQTESGYEAVSKALQELVDLGFVLLDEGQLNLGFLEETLWLNDALIQGDLSAWELVDLFPPSRRKYNPDTERLAEIGLIGETFVMSKYREALPDDLFARVKHTSLVDDSAGYDIVVPSEVEHSVELYLEVKSTVRPRGETTFHLTRNEAKQAQGLANWYLVLVNVGSVNREVGHLEGSSVVPYLPEDKDPRFMWESVLGKFSEDDLRSGLPGLRH
jgi:hypothetical protein